VSTPQWIESAPANQGSLSAAQIEAWRTQGFTLVHDLLPRPLLEAAAADADQAFPAAGTDAAEAFTQFGSNQHFVFPSASAAVNAVTLDPHRLQAVADLLEVTVSELPRTHADMWVKYGRRASAGDGDNADQRMHCDYPNHTLTHPPPWHAPEAVEIIVFLADVDDCGGSTAVVARRGDDDPAYPWPITQTPGVDHLPYINDRARAEAYLRKHAPAAA